MLDLLEQERGAIVLRVPTMLQRILDAPSIEAPKSHPGGSFHWAARLYRPS